MPPDCAAAVFSTTVNDPALRAASLEPHRYPRALWRGPRPWNNDTDEELAAMAAVHAALMQLPPAIPGRQMWLGVLSLAAEVLRSPRPFLPERQFAALSPLSLHVHHFDAAGEADANFHAFAQLPWYTSAFANSHVRRRFFYADGGCKLAIWRRSIRATLTPGGADPTPYTHVWFVDSDLDFRPGIFHLAAFQALVAHTAPLVAQPAILPKAKGRRASDYWSLAAKPSTQVTGRERVRSKTCARRCADPIEVQCPLIDVRLLASFYETTMSFAATQDTLQQWALNRIAFHVARALGEAQPSGTTRRRPAGMVYDWVPLVHAELGLLPKKFGAGGPALRARRRCVRGSGPNGSVFDAAHALAVRPPAAEGALADAIRGCAWLWRAAT